MTSIVRVAAPGGQDVLAGSTYCSPTFIDAWKLTLNAQWNQV
jgi:hypothetical protein